jgi:hypothetical protein
VYCFAGAFGCYVVDVFWLPHRILVDVSLRYSTTQVTYYLMKLVVCVQLRIFLLLLLCINYGLLARFSCVYFSCSYFVLIMGF